MGQIQKLRNTVTRDSKLKHVSSFLATDAQSYIAKLLEFVTTKYEDIVETSTTRNSDSWGLVVEELHNVQSEVTNVVQ